MDGVDSDGYTPLDYAIRLGNSDYVSILLSHGADIGRRPHYLFWTAVVSGNCASTQLLLDRGFRPNDLVPYSPEDNLHRVSKKFFQIFLHYNNHYEDYKPAMDKLLIDYGFDFNTAVFDGITALMACCFRGSSRGGTKRMKSLLEHGVDPEIKDQYGRRAIHYALHNDKVPAFEMLIKYGARLDARTSKGETVLHMAVEGTSEVAMVHALSKAGIMQLDLDARRHDGKIAFDVLRRRAASTEGFLCKYPSRLGMHKKHIECHVQIIRAFESLFQEIQEHQGVPLEERYPPLPIAALGEVITTEPAEDTYSASTVHGIYEVSDEYEIPTNHDSNEPICAPPGAWPE